MPISDAFQVDTTFGTLKIIDIRHTSLFATRA